MRIRSSTSKPLMSGRRRSSTTQSQGSSRKVESAPAPVPVVTISMSSWSSSSLMLIRSAALSSTINRRLRRGLAYSLICASAALTPSVVVGLLTKENAPRASACWRSSSSVMTCTGMWRVRGLCLSWLSTVQPSMSGRNTSSETAAGWILLGKLQRFRAARGHQHLEALVAGEVDQHPRIVRVVLDDQQDGVAGLEIEPVVRNLLDGALRHRPLAAPEARCARWRAAVRAAPPSGRNISAADRA